jgi:hypothetical protein
MLASYSLAPLIRQIFGNCSVFLLLAASLFFGMV